MNHTVELTNEKLSERTRNYKIDNLRALAIVSVVLGHSIILYSPKWNIFETTVECAFLQKLYQFIASYQMALFVLLSGYLFFNSCLKEIPFSSFITNKAKRLILPYFIVGLLYMIPIKMVLNIPTYADIGVITILKRFVLGIDNGHLWFLYSLFLIFLILYPLNRKTIRYKLAPVAILSLIIVLRVVVSPLLPHIFNLTQAIAYALWFQVGVILAKNNRSEIIASACIVLLWGAVFSRVAILTLVILALLYIFVPNRLNTILSKISKNSFGIYLFHSPLIYITCTFLTDRSPLLIVFLNFVVGGIFAYLLTTGIRKSCMNKYIGV